MKKENVIAIASEAIDIYEELIFSGTPKGEAKNATLSSLRTVLETTDTPLDRRWDNFLARKSAP